MGFSSYYNDANGKLVVRDELYKLKIKNIDDIVVKNAWDVIDDIAKEVRDEDISEEIKLLKNAKEKARLAGGSENAQLSFDEKLALKNFNNTSIKSLTLGDKKAFDTFLDKYRYMKYDAIVDPEDFVNGFELPLIILNPEKFEIEGIDALKYDDYYYKRYKEQHPGVSYKKYLKMKGKK